MQNRELHINGKLIELSESTRIGVTLQANTLGELQNRQGTYTNTFMIPLTRKNQLALEFSNLMPSASLIPYRKNLGTYIENGVEIISEGETKIVKADDNFIHIETTGGNVDLSRAIGDVIVGDLYADDAAHEWNLINVLASRLGLSYYLYPLIDWRTDIDTYFDTTTIDIRQMLPTCIVSGLFSRLEIYTGYTFKGSYITSDEHLNMILTPDAFSVNPEYVSDLQTESTIVTGAVANGMIIEVAESSGTIQQEFPLNMVLDGAGFTDGVYFAPTNHIGKLRFTGTIAFAWNYDNGGIGVFETPQSRDYWFLAQIKKDGAVIAEKTFPTQTGTIYDLNSFIDFVIDIQTDEQLLTTGSSYFCNVIVNVESHTNADTILDFGFTPNNYVKFQHTPSEGLVFGNDIRFKDIFRMKAKDVLTDILNLRGLIIQTNSFTKEVSFNFFQDLVDNKINALDWSDKIDIRGHELNYKFGEYAQRNNFRFKEDDSVEDELGDSYFDIDDQTLSESSDVVQISHSATEQTSKYLGLNIPSIEAIDALNKWQKPSFRLLQLDKQATTFTTNYTDGTTTTSVQDSIPFARFVGFEDLVPDFYGILQDILDQTKGILLMTKLNSLDIQNLNFVIPIFLDVPELEINGYFYINKIANYKQGLTPVEYIRL